MTLLKLKHDYDQFLSAQIYAAYQNLRSPSIAHGLMVLFGFSPNRSMAYRLM